MTPEKFNVSANIQKRRWVVDFAEANRVLRFIPGQQATSSGLRLRQFLGRIAQLVTFERPDTRDGEFERVAIRIAKINGRRIISESEFALDGDAVQQKALAPDGKFVSLDTECHVPRAGRAVGGQCSIAPRDVRAE